MCYVLLYVLCVVQVPRVGPWREGDIGGDSFLNWGIGEVDTLNSRQAVVVVMCSPPPTRMWSLEAAILYRLNLTDNPQPGASISNTENSATMPEARADAPLLVIMTPDRSTEAAVRMAFELSNANFSVATIAINGTADVLHFGQKPIVEGCDIFQLCMRVHASPAQTATSAFQTYLDRRFPLLLVTPSFAGGDRPLFPVPDRPMRIGQATLLSHTHTRTHAHTHTHTNTHIYIHVYHSCRNLKNTAHEQSLRLTTLVARFVQYSADRANEFSLTNLRPIRCTAGAVRH